MSGLKPKSFKVIMQEAVNILLKDIETSLYLDVDESVDPADQLARSILYDHDDSGFAGINGVLHSDP